MEKISVEQFRTLDKDLYTVVAIMAHTLFTSGQPLEDIVEAVSAESHAPVHFPETVSLISIRKWVKELGEDTQTFPKVSQEEIAVSAKLPTASPLTDNPDWIF